MLIKNARVIDPANGRDGVMDILLQNGKIMALQENLPQGAGPCINAEGLVACPGLIDMHVHLRDPGFTHKEDILSGCRAAAAGGFTAVAPMPNTQPVTDCPALIAYALRTAQQAACRLLPTAAITLGQRGETLTNFAALKAAGAVAFTDDGHPVENNATMRNAILLAKEEKLPIISHCEDLNIINKGIVNKGRVSQALGVRGMDRSSEDTITARECALALETGGHVHIAHVSTRGAVEIIRQAKAQGAFVTAETGPHYFALTEEALQSRNANFRMNPPLREAADVEAITEGLRDGTLDCIATDHAPHAPHEKANFLNAPNGVVGLETSLAVTLTQLYHAQYFSLEKIVRLMSLNPAMVLGVAGGTLSPGATADITLFDPEESWVVDPQQFRSKSRNTPFAGKTLKGRVKYTILAGRITYADTPAGKT